ncbi:MAG: type II toxin-antitoxin system RelE/ParE family toxin [Bacteriovoracaceae bacterium]
MKVVVLEMCKKEMADFPEEVLESFVDAIALLTEGIILGMPLSKSMPSIGNNIHELRFKDKSGIYRVFYVINKKDAIYAVHAFQKKSQKTPKKNIELVKKRIRRL